MTWILLSVAASIVWAVSHVIDKFVLTKYFDKAVVPTVLLGVMGLAASLLVSLTQGIEALSLLHIAIAVLGGVSYAVMALCYYYAVQRDEISKVIPLFYFSPLFIAVAAAIFLGEVFGPLKYIGIGLLVVGAFLITSDGKVQFAANKTLWLMLVAAFCSAFTQVLTKYLLEFADFWTIFAYIRLGAFLTLLPIGVWSAQYFLATYRQNGILPFGWVALSEILNNVAILLLIAAVAIGYVTLVNAMTSVQPFFVLLMMVVLTIWYPHILREEIHRETVARKIFAMALMFGGALLIS